jgi:hypothetical protein
VISQHTICALPDSHPNYRHFAITVEHRGNGRWAVCHSRFCLGTDGDWDFEPASSDRDDDWLDSHRFDEQTALRLAAEQAPHMTCNDLTVADALARAGS